MVDRSSPLWTDSPMTRVFISHATKDREFVEKEIIPLLQRHGIQIWYSKDDIYTAADWEQAIRQGLESCDWFLVVLTPKSVTSPWVQAEVHWGIEERKNRFVPVLAEDCGVAQIHLMIRTIQFVDFRQASGEAQRLLLKCWNISPVSPERDQRIKGPGGEKLPEEPSFPGRSSRAPRSPNSCPPPNQAVGTVQGRPGCPDRKPIGRAAPADRALVIRRTSSRKFSNAKIGSLRFSSDEGYQGSDRRDGRLGDWDNPRCDCHGLSRSVWPQG